MSYSSRGPRGRHGGGQWQQAPKKAMAQPACGRLSKCHLMAHETFMKCIGDFGAIPLVYERHIQREGIRPRNRHELIHVQGKSLALLSSSNLNYLARRKEWAQLGSIAEREMMGWRGARQLRALGSLAEDLSPDAHTGRLPAHLPDVGSQHRLPDCADTGLTCMHTQIHKLVLRIKQIGGEEQRILMLAFHLHMHTEAHLLTSP